MNTVVIVIMTSALIGLWQSARMRKAMNTDLADDCCVACNSSNLADLGPGAYRCKACGYEGGSGLKKIQEQAKEEAIDALDPAARRRAAIIDLREARTLLLAASGSMKNVISLSKADMIGLPSGWDGGTRKNNELNSAMADILRAKQHIDDASLKSGNDILEGDELNIDFSSLEFSLDTYFADNFFSDVAVHKKIKKVNRHAEHMAQAVNAALTNMVNAS
jgi:ribosomal protein L37AE/L43A